MKNSSQSTVEDTVKFWEGRTNKRLTAEDGREIIENIVGFLQTLADWDREERDQNNDLAPVEDHSVGLSLASSACLPTLSSGCSSELLDETGKCAPVETRTGCRRAGRAPSLG